MLRARPDPRAAYRRVEFDARVASSDPRQLVALCYESFVTELGTALFAASRCDMRMKSEALMRAIAALTALQLGVRGDGAVVAALHQLYASARDAVLDNVLNFDPATITRIRQDFTEIAAALAGA